ncbi:MAG: manganese efflux pump MntP family protein [Coriobacteriia bacterium]|nr:manganese efflux pump MntP family protein [Coriobacteriia bacterium]
MILIELLLVAVGLSMDTFAVGACIGLATKGKVTKTSIIVGLYFGSFHVFVPLIGYVAGAFFADRITNYDHWIAFALLGFLGLKMIVSSLREERCEDRECPDETCSDRDCPKLGIDNEAASLHPKTMLPLAVATSIDALAVGISFAFLRVNVIAAALTIGITTFFIAIIGVRIGKLFGAAFKSKAELAGGIILMGIGIKILIEHMIG